MAGHPRPTTRQDSGGGPPPQVPRRPGQPRKRGTYNTSTGTSDATALVSATAALIRAKYPDLSANGVINRLIKTADDKGPPGRDPQYGFGVVNPLKALTADIPDIDYNPLVKNSSPSVTSTVASPDVDATGDRSWLLPVLGGVAAAVIIVMVVLGILLVRRRRTPTGAAYPPSPGHRVGGPSPPG
ncbi:MAG: S8 family serine peptidase [Micromonosporaceae bacterium]